MTRDEIVEAAREADAANDPVLVTPFLERFATIIERKAAEAEREACEALCLGEIEHYPGQHAAAIRARTGDSA